MKKPSKVLIYEIYPSSWPGGFSSMSEHLKRVANLHVDYVWLAPCYPSGGFDGGYDVTDYLSINPAYGTLQDFDNFVKEANRLGIKVVMDLVLNHTSSQHEWFKRSVKGEPPYNDYYLWSDQDLGWGTVFDGSSAFEWNEERKQFYCHIYHKSQPDLNWDNPRLIDEFTKIINFWTLEHGVSGFRLDSIQSIGKSFTKTILPRDKLGTVAGIFKYSQKPKTPKILTKLFEDRDLFTFGEIAIATRSMFDKMVKPHGPLTAGFNLSVSYIYDKLLSCIEVKGSLSRLNKMMQKWSKHPSFIAMLESHDIPRFTSRANVTGKTAIKMLFNSGAQIVCLYQGQELGLKNPDLGNDISTYHDIQTIMRYHTAVTRGENPTLVIQKLKNESRDNARVPINLEEYFRQEANKASCLEYTKRLIKKWK